MIRFLYALPLMAAVALLCAPTLRAEDGSNAAALDSNHDGLVSRPEAEYDGKLGLRFDSRFDSLDANKDGRLDSAELPGLETPAPGTATVGGPSGAGRSSSPETMDGATAPAPSAGSSAGPAVPSAPGLPSGGGRVAAPAGAAPSPAAGARTGGR